MLDFTRLMLISIQVDVVVEVGVELGKIFIADCFPPIVPEKIRFFRIEICKLDFKTVHWVRCEDVLHVGI